MIKIHQIRKNMSFIPKNMHFVGNVFICINKVVLYHWSVKMTKSNIYNEMFWEEI